MNKIYRLVFSKSHGAMVAVSEITKGRSKGGGKTAIVGAAISAALAAAGIILGDSAFAQSSPCPSTINGAALPCSIPAGGVSIGAQGIVSGGDIALSLSNSIGGAVNNAGTLIGNVTGIALTNSVLNGGIANSGTIYGVDVAGINILNGSSITGGITNNDGGTISGKSTGISVIGSSIVGGISNTGTIFGGTYSGINVISSQISGGINNLAGGLISGGADGAGIAIQGGGILNGGILNSGSISGATAGILLKSSATINGGIINNGTIFGNEAGILLLNNGSTHGAISISGGISNAGLLVGAFGGIFSLVTNTDLSARNVISGGITNSGTIISAFDGIGALNNTTIDSVSNSGTILSLLGPGIGVSAANADTSINTIVNTGTIIGGAKLGGETYLGGAGIKVGSINVSGTSLGGIASINNGITNTGLILGAGTLSAGIAVGSAKLGGYSGSRISFAGGIINGGITNSGVILGMGTLSSGIQATLNSTINEGINNLASGLISGSSTGISLRLGSSVSGGISNSGSIFGGASAIHISSGSTLSGGINNNGIINGGGSAIAITSSALSGGINNSASGTLYGGTTAVFLHNASVAGGINNSGQIIGYGSDGFYIVGSTISGGISNSGTIYGGANGISISNNSVVLGGISNSGLIQGAGQNTEDDPPYIGLKVSSSTVVDGINNSGTIIGANLGMSIFGGSSIVGTISNSGTIIGSNGAAILLSNSSVSGGILNRGTIYSSTQTAIILNGGTISGGIRNSGTILGGGYSGMFMLNGSSIAGGIVNSGLIQGNGIGLGIFSSHVDGITNLAGGTIAGLGFSGIATTFGGAIDSISNFGTIIGATGISVGTTGSLGSLTNNHDGVIAATNPSTGYALNLLNTSGTITVANSGSLIGNVNLGINSLQINGQVARILGDTNSGANVTNNGRFNTEGNFTVDSFTNNGVLRLNNTIIRGVSNTGVLNVGSYAGDLSGNPTITGGFNNTGVLNARVIDTGSYGTNPSAITNQYLVVDNATLGTSSGYGIAPGLDLLNGALSTPTPLVDTTFGGSIYTAEVLTATGAFTGTPTQTGGIYTYNGLSTNYTVTLAGNEVSLTTIGIVTGYDTFTPTVSGSGTNAHYYGANIGSGITIGQGTDAYGIKVASGGSIQGGITNSGTLQGTIAGVGILNNSTLLGAIVNNAGGVMQGTPNGSQYGIQVSSLSTVTGGINNAGTIIGGTVGIAITSNATVLNGIVNSGTINGLNGYGISVQSYSTVTGGINNSGTINANNGSGAHGYALRISNSTILGGITNTGSIGGYGIGVTNGLVANGINNAGLISSKYTAINLNTASISGGVSNTGTIRSLAGSAISLFRSSVTGGITNSGLIDASAGTAGLRLRSGVITNGVTNTGTILGGATGIRIASNSSISGGLTNSGTVAGTSIGINVIDHSAIIEGVTNLVGGKITGYNNGIFVANNSVISSGILNAGTIFGAQYGVQLTGGAVVGGITNLASGVIGSNADTRGGLVVGYGSTLAGSISNGGTIFSAGVNSGAIKIGYSPIGGNATLLGGITNAGSILGLGLGSSAIEVANSSYIDQGINNLSHGLIQGGNSGIAISSGSIVNNGITNSGTIISLNEGIIVVNSSIKGGINNATGGTISGGSGGGILLVTNSTLTGGIINSGTLAGLGTAGLVVAANSALNGGITNSGLIQGGAAIGNAGIYIDATSSIDSITNTGTITGYYGINNQGTIGSLVNAQGGTGFIPGPLTYNGKLPTNYTALIGSQSSYGQLNVIGTYSGQMTFNVGIITGAAPTNGTYRGVLQGISYSGIAGLASVNSTLAGSISGTSYKWILADDASSASYWDLILSGYAPPAPTPSANYVSVVTANNNPAALGAAQVLDAAATAGTPGLAGVVTQLNNIGSTSGSLAQSNAISQTLPVIVGAGSQAAAQNQQGLNQIMQGRQNQLRGLSSGDEFIGTRDVWMKGYGSWANQDSVNNVSGYKVNTGGLAVGIDKQLSPKSNIGAVFAFGNSSVSSNNSAAPSGITVNSYQLGAYGDYAIKSDLQANYQADVGLNNNKSYRNLSDFSGVQGIGANANANYNNTVAHVGAGLRQFVPLTDKTTFIPSIRADYTTVQSQGYTESGGGALNLNVNSQSYNMMMLSADLRMDYELTEKLKVSANVGGGYNTLNNQVQITSAYQGGGTAFATNGLQVSPWLYNAGLGVSGRIDKNTELNVRYDTQFTTTSYNNQMVSAKVKFWY